MKRKIALILAIVGITVSSFAFTGSNANTVNGACPLRGTPACPENPSCCK
jgi:hypothetical protein